MIVKVKDSGVHARLLDLIAQFCAENGYNSFSDPSEYDGEKIGDGVAVLMGINLEPGVDRHNSILVTGCDTKDFINRYGKHMEKLGLLNAPKKREGRVNEQRA